jgi:mono/diheme cytochrome c family protein
VFRSLTILSSSVVALCLTAAVASVVHLSARQQPFDPAGPAIDFAGDIRPILEANCYECHGPRKARGQLRFDRRTNVFAGGMSGPAIAPGDSENSVLVRRLLGLDGEDRMPLDKDPLPDAQIALIRRWIDQGAPWPETPGEAAAAQAPEPARHWAYVRPVRRAPPPVRNEGWGRTPIDHFVLARLEAEGLTPSPEASKEALLRRVSLDLVGLPPTPQEIDAFLGDGSPDAYDRVVDRLLASPHYGERWARPWLDLSRYADSNGYEKDDLRTMWKYRDWVIDALNRDMPFDQFTIEQLAGDMLPGATPAQRVATGFHRNTLLNQEGGIDVEEARWETLVDRVNTTGTVWLGSTIACAQCHNHKYDPFSQRDYYRVLAFFDNGEYSVHGKPGGDHWIAEPELDLPTPDQAAKRTALQAELDEVQRQLDAPGADIDAGQLAWERAMLAADHAWTPLVPESAQAGHGTVLTPRPDASVVARGPAPASETYTVRAQTALPRITALRLEVLPDESLPQGGPGRDYYGNFVLTGIGVTAAPRAAGGREFPVTLREAHADDAFGGTDLRDLLMKPEDDKGDLPAGWAIDATRDATRLRRQAVFVLAEPVSAPRGAALTIALSFHGTAVSQAIGRFRLSVADTDDPLKVVAVRARTRAALEMPGSSRSDDTKKAVVSEYRAQAAALAPLRKRAEALQKAIADLKIVSALVLQERPSYDRPSTFMRERGSFLSKGEKVYAGTPRVLPPMADDQMPNRLGLARWLVSPANPLTARVTVNRAWEQFFGRGLVETSEDFGTQGSAPSHAELLDWLATELVAQKWSLKAIHRLIVTSATYRQSAAITTALVERDANNRLLARGPRFRMEAEMLRDAALAAAGLLSPTIGGPSVFPPQPEGIWDNPYSDATWVTSEGEDRYRRSLYTFIRRTSPYPSLVTFDATSRELCTVRRVRTNTPLQALTMLNDEAFFEAARAVAGRMILEGGTTARGRAAYGFRLVTSRMPTAGETNRIVASYEKQLAHFRAHRDAAARVERGPALTLDGAMRPLPATDAGAIQTKSASRAGATNAMVERAAWTMVANALLNLDEAVNK